MQKQDKFYSKLKKLVRQKLIALHGDAVTGSNLPEKGNELAQLLLKHISSIDEVGEPIKSVFDKIAPKETTATTVEVATETQEVKPVEA